MAQEHAIERVPPSPLAAGGTTGHVRPSSPLLQRDGAAGRWRRRPPVHRRRAGCDRGGSGRGGGRKHGRSGGPASDSCGGSTRRLRSPTTTPCRRAGSHRRRVVAGRGGPAASERGVSEAAGGSRATAPRFRRAGLPAPTPQANPAAVQEVVFEAGSIFRRRHGDRLRKSRESSWRVAVAGSAADPGRNEGPGRFRDSRRRVQSRQFLPPRRRRELGLRAAEFPKQDSELLERGGRFDVGGRPGRARRRRREHRRMDRPHRRQSAVSDAPIPVSSGCRGRRPGRTDREQRRAHLACSISWFGSRAQSKASYMDGSRMTRDDISAAAPGIDAPAGDRVLDPAPADTRSPAIDARWPGLEAAAASPPGCGRRASPDAGGAACSGEGEPAGLIRTTSPCWSSVCRASRSVS